MRACLTMMDRKPEAVEKALTNKSRDSKGIRHENTVRTALTVASYNDRERGGGPLRIRPSNSLSRLGFAVVSTFDLLD